MLVGAGPVLRAAASLPRILKLTNRRTSSGKKYCACFSTAVYARFPGIRSARRTRARGTSCPPSRARAPNLMVAGVVLVTDLEAKALLVSGPKGGPEETSIVGTFVVVPMMVVMAVSVPVTILACLPASGRVMAICHKGKFPSRHCARLSWRQNGCIKLVEDYQISNAAWLARGEASRRTDEGRIRAHLAPPLGARRLDEIDRHHARSHRAHRPQRRRAFGIISALSL
jgi:hypothetical protein